MSFTSSLAKVDKYIKKKKIMKNNRVSNLGAKGNQMHNNKIHSVKTYFEI